MAYTMARTQRNTTQTLKLKIKLTIAKVTKMKTANDKAVNRLKKMYDLKRTIRKILF